MKFSYRHKLLVTTAIASFAALSFSDAQAQLITSIDDGIGQQQRCGGATTCNTGTNVGAGGISIAGPSYSLLDTNPEIIIDSDTALRHGQNVTENTDNVFISVEHNVTNTTANGYGLEISAFGNTEASGSAEAVISVADNISLHSLGLDFTRTLLASGPSTDGILLGADADIPNGLDINGSVRATGGGNAVDFSAADAGITININSLSTIEGNLVLGQGDTIIFDDSTTGSTQTLTFNDDIIGDTGGGDETVRIDADGDIIIFGGEILNIATLDIAAGEAQFTGTSGNASNQTSFGTGVTMGNGATLRAEGGAQLLSNIDGSSGENTVILSGTSRIGSGSNTFSLLGGNDVLTINDDARIDFTSIDMGGGDDTLTFGGDVDTTNGLGLNFNIDGGAGTGDEIVVNLADDTDARRFGGAISGIEDITVSGGDLIFLGTSTLADTPNITVTGTNTQVDFYNTAGATFGTLDMQASDTDAFFGLSTPGAVYAGNITAGTGQQDITLFEGTLDSDVALGAGTNSLNVQGGTFTGTYTSAGGTDNITLQSNGDMSDFTLTDTDGTGSTFTTNRDFEIVNDTIIDGFGINVGANSTLTVTSDTALGSNTDLGNVFVFSGSTLNGTGTIRNAGSSLNISGGTYAPGNSIGTQVITGNYSQSGSGTLQIEFDDTSIDLVDITGSATLSGEVEFIELAAGATLDTPLTFLEADGGVTGTFSTVTQTFLTGSILTDATVGYDANSAFVTLQGFTTVDNNNDTDNTPTKTNGGAKVTTAVDNAPTSTELTNIINALRAGDDVDDALDSQSNIVANTAINQANGAIGQIISTVRAQINANTATVTQTGVSSGDTAHDLFNRATKWTQAVGAYSTIDSDSSARGSSSRAYGAAFGMEAPMDNRDAVLGVFVGYTQSDTDVDGLNDESEVHNYQFGLYGSHDIEDTSMRVSGTVSGSYLDFETRRGTTQGIAKGEFDGWGAYADVELAYDLDLERDYSLSPFAALQASVIDRDGYTETGAGILNNTMQDETTEYLTTVIGVEAAGDYTVDDTRFIPKARIGWAHQFLDNSTQTTASFASAQNVVFETEGPERDRDSLRLGLDLEFAPVDNSEWTAFVRYNGDIASNAQDHMIRIGAGLKF